MFLEKEQNGVYYYRNVIENPKEIVELVDKTEFNDSITNIFPKWEEWGVDVDRGQRYVYGLKKIIALNDIRDIDTPPWNLNKENYEVSKKVFDAVFNGFRMVCEDYAKRNNIEDNIDLLWQFGIHKYKARTWMGTHYDSQEGDTRLKSSMLMYLNDDYEGGEISFTVKDGVLSNVDKYFKDNPWNHLVEHYGDTNPNAAVEDVNDEYNEDKIDFFIKPEAGSCIIFPSQAPFSHTAHLVKSGWKYLIPGFWINPDGYDSVRVKQEKWEVDEEVKKKVEDWYKSGDFNV